jgi:hypothetical protein
MSRQRTSTCVTSGRRVVAQVRQRKVHKAQKRHKEIVHSTCELDSQADTCVAGPNCILLEYTDQVVNISAYSEQLETMENIPIDTTATALDDPKTGITTILVIGQALYMGDKVKSTFLCPNQLRANGLVVDNIPKHLAPKDRPSSHSIYSPDDDYVIPLNMKGIFSGFETRTPTWEELDTCRHIKLTNDHAWNPHSTDNLTEHLIGDCGIPSEYRRIMQVIQENLNYVVSPFIRHTTRPIEQRFRTRQAQLRYNQLVGRHGRFYTAPSFCQYPH